MRSEESKREKLRPGGNTRKKREGRQEGSKKQKGCEVEGRAHGKRQKERTREECEREDERMKREEKLQRRARTVKNSAGGTRKTGERSTRKEKGKPSK